MIYYQDKELVIRDMEEADGTVFVEEFTAQGWHPSLDYYQKRMQERAEGKCAALTAEYQGKQAGYVYLFLAAEEGPFAGKGWPIIVDFNVLKKYQRKGIGGRLMDAKRGYIPDGSGVWYQDRQCVQYETVCTVDDDLVLFLYKKLQEECSGKEN